ncbi:Uncharacterised protein [Acinetobacter calcoaceticus]|uniref:Uncharacterized protein n=1 Tax=Acinetobacter calcoaceticus TaxID=471 RepID=A0A446ZM35_ACICA|nr:hypothetical protein [Acinetobacter calcoaceticus]VAX45470.1 Uncharacterised protein [Acinetobacter calcoaceticus]
MKIPVRFRKLSKSDIKKIEKYFDVFGEVRSIGETEKRTTLYYYPNNISSANEDLKIIQQILKIIGFRDYLIED